MKETYIVFDGPPERTPGRFVEAEDGDGVSVRAGKWEQRGEFWRLGPFVEADVVRRALTEVRKYYAGDAPLTARCALDQANAILADTLEILAGETP